MDKKCSQIPSALHLGLVVAQEHLAEVLPPVGVVV